MNARTLLTIAVTATLLVGGVAAVGAAAPTDASTNAGAADAADDPGPSDGLPSVAPEFVSDILDRIGSFTSGSVDHLGTSLSELLSGGDAADRAT